MVPGVLSFLSQLEVQARCRRDQSSRVKELRAEVEELRAQRDLLKAEIETHKVGNAIRAVGGYLILFTTRNNNDTFQHFVRNQS